MSTYERHVLFVDDESEMQEMIQNLLEPRGVHVSVVSDGMEALRLMRGGLRPDVILSDLELPTMDGFALLRAVRENREWAPIPFIVLTGHVDKPTVRRAMMAGVDDFITKPLDEERLLLTIYSKAKRTQELTRYAEAAHETLAYVRRDMARMFTHELRTPLVSMNMVAELLTKHSGDMTAQDAQELIETLQTGLTRLNRLSEQMVLLIQLDTGELQKLIREAATPGPLWDALNAAVSQARTFTYRQRDIDVEYRPNGISGDIRAEWKSLRHALAELLANALVFSPTDQPVTITQTLDGDAIALEIVDRGPGIPEEAQADLFRRFNQVEREKHDQQGIGMGLYLAKNIIEAGGGKLELDSVQGQGTTIHVTFPLVDASLKRATDSIRQPEQAPAR